MYFCLRSISNYETIQTSTGSKTAETYFTALVYIYFRLAKDSGPETFVANNGVRAPVEGAFQISRQFKLLPVVKQ